MKLSDLVNYGLFENLDRLCGTTINTYPAKSKISDLNDALDWYFSLAFKADHQWSFDDINETSPPIDTQSIVSGTNRYKISSFTEKIFNLIKLEILDDDARGYSLIPETIDNLSDSFEELYLDSSNTGQPTHYIKYGDFIYLRPFPNYSETNGLKAYFNRPASKFEFVSCQAEADDELITATAHGLAANDTVIFNTVGTIPTGITANTTYYVISTGLTANVFSVSTSLGGGAVNITDDGTNTHFLKTNAEPGIVSPHHAFLYRKAALTFLSQISSNKIGWLANQVLKDEEEIMAYFGQRTKDMPKIIIPAYQDNR